ncbi:8672_t:CDS:2 [Ambispora gerdemannii]|uniref:8672_t:CDS:1 n=1 Tax=Ambispora gerdemannii TaxID=144530 RepID=A0A9N9A5V1_9GLOM|nr:8672_t:CDS:2 [Ambispora gerdemannii]
MNDANKHPKRTRGTDQSTSLSQQVSLILAACRSIPLPDGIECDSL